MKNFQKLVQKIRRHSALFKKATTISYLMTILVTLVTLFRYAYIYKLSPGFELMSFAMKFFASFFLVCFVLFSLLFFVKGYFMRGK
jgi:hypothetical protein